jgi:hypothetical protein
VSWLRRDPLRELAERQLELFAADEAALLAEAAEAETTWTRSAREDAEEAYGDYQLVVDAVADRLLDLRETYAATLPDENLERYRAAFGEAARRRFRRYTSLLADLDDLA